MLGNYLQQTTSADDIFRCIFLGTLWVNSLPSGLYFMLFLSSADFIKNQLFRKNSFRNTTRVSNNLDPDQARHFVGLDLVPNCCKSYQQTPLGGKELTTKVL